jgi:hypothetical protein
LLLVEFDVVAVAGGSKYIGKDCDYKWRLEGPVLSCGPYHVKTGGVHTSSKKWPEASEYLQYQYHDLATLGSYA